MRRRLLPPSSRTGLDSSCCAGLPDLIDISLDAGPRFYRNVRGNGYDHFPRILAGVRALRNEHPDLTINALHTLCAENTRPDIVADMIVGSQEIISPNGQILF